MAGEHVIENAPLPESHDDSLIDDPQESQEFVEEEKEEQPPESGTPAETVDALPEQVELTAQEKRFMELGLDKQFPDGIGQMIENMPNYNAAYTQALQKRNVPEAPPVESKPRQVTQESYEEDPATALQTLFAQQEQVQAQRDVKLQKRMDNNDYDTFMASKKDSAQMLPSMVEMSNLNPDLQSLPVRSYMPILYEIAKASQIPATVAQAAKTAQTTVTDPKLAEAGLPGKTERTTGEPSLQEMANMSLDDMEKILPRMKRQ